MRCLAMMFSTVILAGFSPEVIAVNQSVNLHAQGSSYRGQVQQDRWINENFFKNQRDGVFVDIGAHDGVRFSNTYFFEKSLGWTGLCIEPIPQVFTELKKNRSCHLVRGGIGAIEGTREFLRAYGPLRVEMLSGFLDMYDARHLARVHKEIEKYGGGYEIIPVQVYHLNRLLEECGFSTIDFLSLDTEGGELEILKSIDFDRFLIRAMTVENNYQEPDIENFLTENGYVKVANLEWDEVYILASELE